MIQNYQALLLPLLKLFSDSKEYRFRDVIEPLAVKFEVTGEGIDGAIMGDKPGLDIIYIQAKRWKTGKIASRPELQKFVGTLAGQRAKKGIFITTSNFTKETSGYKPKNETKIKLIDGE
ncbi:MAG: restriction endonuclease [Bacteroidia bacterium]|nr:restriction endonuclease [Bacteroidia bacterium]